MDIKKISSLLLAVMVATAAFLGGCGSQPGGSGQDTPSASDGALELFSTKAENLSTLQALVDKFTEENEGVTITVMSPADAGTVLRSRLTKNDIPDIIAVGGDATYTELAGAGVLLDLTGEAFLDRIQENYMQMLFDVHTNKEETPFAVPYATNGSGILYNKDLFAQAGVEAPTTWSEFLEVISKLKEAGINPFELTFVDNWTCLPSWNSMAPVLNPLPFTDERKAGTATFAGTHGEVLEKYLVILNACESDYMGTSYDDGNAKFANGSAAMMINGNWAIPEFLKTNPDLNVDLCAFPTTDDASKNTLTSGVDVAFAISASSPQAETAKAFLEFLTREENAQQYIDEQFAFSAVKGVEQENPTVAGVKQAIANGQVSDFPDHYYPAGFDLAAILSEFVMNCANGMEDAQNIEQTLQNCDTQYDAVNVG